MKIFIFTTYFAPSVGGIERVTELLATQFAEFGHEVVLATLTPGQEQGPWRFPVIRRPGARQFLSLVKWCDVHLQANLSLKHFYARLARRAFVVHHGTYYTHADGTRGLRDHLKLICARLVHGVACSRYIARQVSCGDVIGNPYDESIFRVRLPLDARDKDVAFLGRLVSEKGCDTLFEALSILRGRGLVLSCTVIGEGPERDRLAKMVRSANLNGAVRFLNSLHGAAIASELNRHRIVAVPSRYDEPFGIVAVEGLACGCVPVVSERGGLVDAIGPHGLTFQNGNAGDLADRLESVLREPGLAQQLLKGVEGHLAELTARRVAQRYLEVFERILG